MHKCPICKGKGEVEMLWLENKGPTIERCSECDGSGEVEDNEDDE